MALREYETLQDINLEQLPPKNPLVIPPIPELDSILRQTEEFNISVEEAKAEMKCVDVSVSLSEKVICLLLRKMGCNIPLPLYEGGVSAASVKGTAFHELRALAWLLMQRAREKDIEKIMPNEKKPEPYARMVGRHKIAVGASENEALEVVENAWLEFYKDSELVKAQNPRDWREEYGIRQTCYDEGRALLAYYVTQHYQPHDLNKRDYRRYLEVLWSRRSKYGVQVKGRYDSVCSYEKDGKLHYKIEDLKTGSNNFDVVKQLIHDWQAQIMLLCGEPFCIQFLPTGFLKKRPNIHATKCPDHYFQEGQDKVEVDYEWYDRRTRQISIEHVTLSGNRNQANEMFTWYGLAIKAYEPEVRAYLKYLKTGEGEPEPVIPRQRRFRSPLIQQTFDFDRPPEVAPEIQQEFEEISEKIDSNNPENKPLQVGFVGEPIGTCDCGSSIGNFYKYIGGKGTGMPSMVVVSEKCMSCGMVYKKNPPERISKRATYSQGDKPHPTS